MQLRTSGFNGICQRVSSFYLFRIVISSFRLRTSECLELACSRTAHFKYAVDHALSVSWSNKPCPFVFYALVDETKRISFVEPCLHEVYILTVMP